MNKKILLNFPNAVTFFRVVLVFIVVYFLFSQNAKLYLYSSMLIFALILLDWIDGIVARGLGSSTEFGSVIDIVGDRIVENALWIAFAFIQSVPIWVPFVVIARGFIADGFRSYALSKGKTAFGKKTMMKGSIGVFFVSSRFSRALYGIAKTAAFMLLALHLYFKSMNYASAGFLGMAAFGFVLFTVAFCVLRGIFVVY
ncbi:MAG: CDP-alcohol phosphatidyltransferase family protein, partial [Nanoarchaeota archaeon]